MIVRVASLLRGKIDPPERIEEADAWLVETLDQREAIQLQEWRREAERRRWAQQMAGAA